MSLVGSLGLAVALIEDPEGRVRRRWSKQQEAQATDNGRISRAAMKKARPVVLAELARRGGRSWWEGMTPRQRQAHIAKLNAARAAKRQAGLNRAA
jgi:hypothetical protein